MNNKYSLRKLAIFLGIAALFPLCYFAYISFFQRDLFFLLHAVGDGSANIRTWLDTNANGVYDKDEPPLPNVCVGFVASLDELIRQVTYPCMAIDKTDSRGWGGSEFLPGWTGKIYTFAFPPEGYQPTTDMVSTDYYPEFGFIQEGKKTSLEVETVDEYIRKELIKRWVRYIAIAFLILVIALYGTMRIERALENGDTSNA